jgi:hypothetical protein
MYVEITVATAARHGQITVATAARYGQITVATAARYRQITVATAARREQITLWTLHIKINTHFYTHLKRKSLNISLRKKISQSKFVDEAKRSVLLCPHTFCFDVLRFSK